MVLMQSSSKLLVAVVMLLCSGLIFGARELSGIRRSNAQAPHVWTCKEAEQWCYSASETIGLCWLGDLGERPQATRADVEAMPVTGHKHPLIVYVWPERAAFLGSLTLPPPTMNVADVPTKLRCLAANVAGSTCHASRFLTCENRTPMIAALSCNGQTLPRNRC